MKKSYLSIFLLVFVLILAVSAVGAADLDDTSDSEIQAADDADIVSSDVDDVAISAADEGSDDEVAAASDSADVLAEPEEGNNFTTLQNIINTKYSYSLNKDYVKEAGEDVISIESGKTFTLIGGNHKIDANNNGGIFKVNSGATLILVGVTLVNGNSTYGGAIYNEGELTIESCVFTNNYATNGGAVYSKGTLDIDGSTFNDNTAVEKGGAIYNEGSLIDIDDTGFDSNDIIKRTSEGTYAGAAIYNLNSNLILTNSRVTNNLKGYANGDIVFAAVYSEADVNVDGSTFTNNVGRYGGAIAIMGATLTVTDSSFDKNQALFGGALYVNEAQAIVDASNFAENVATGTGSSGNVPVGGAIAVFSENANIKVTDSVFTKNTATTGSGGAIEVRENTADSTIEGCTFTENTAQVGGAVNFQPSSGTLTVKESSFANNGADYNGAAICSFGGNTIVADSNFTANTAGSQGGAMYVRTGEADVSGSKFTANTANKGNAIYNYKSDLALSENEISSTSADIYNNGGEITSIIKVVILDNDTVVTYNGEYLVTAKITDDNDNLLGNVKGFTFVVDGASVDAVYNATSMLYQGNLVLPVPGVFAVNVTYVDDDKLVVETATINNFKGTFQDLQDKVTNAQDNKLDLEYDFAYTPELGDDVFVYGVVIDKALTINGNGYTISGSDSNRIFYINESAILTLDNIVLTNGNATYGGAILVSDGSLIISNTNFTNNKASQHGGAIYYVNELADNSEITNCIFENNEAVDGSGGAILFEDESYTWELTIRDTKFTNNKAGAAGAIYISMGDVSILNSNFTDNIAQELEGGAVYVGIDTDYVYISKSVFSGNTAVKGNAIYNIGELALNENTISTVNADIYNDGGYIYTDAKVTTFNATVAYGETVNLSAVITDDNDNLIYDSSFVFLVKGNDYPAKYNATTKQYELKDQEFNLAVGTYKITMGSDYVDGITMVETGILTVTPKKGTFTDLQYQINALEDGDALDLAYDFIYTTGYDDVITLSTFDLANGVVINKNITINGNAFTISGNNSNRIFYVNYTNTLILNNATLSEGYTTQNGGAIHVNNIGSPTNKGGYLIADHVIFTDNKALQGGAINIQAYGSLYLTDCIFEDNEADITSINSQGGAIKTNTKCDVTIIGSNFTNNAACNQGGAIYLSSASNVIIEGSKFINSRVVRPAMGLGGALYVGTNAISIAGSDFINNTATSRGGAIYISVSKANMEITDSTFIGNNATSEGGAIYQGSSVSSLITGSIFKDNTNNNIPNAIFLNGGNLYLEDNTINTEYAEIFAKTPGTSKITSPLTVRVLNNKTIDTTDSAYNLTAVLYDDNGNLIEAKDLKFIVNDNEQSTSPAFDAEKGYTLANYDISATGIYVVSANTTRASNLTVETGILRNIKGTFTELQNIIDDAGDELTLTDDFTYNTDIDGAEFVNGVIINKTLTIKGDNHILDGANAARIFNINASDVVLENIQFINGLSDFGGAIYYNSVNGKLNVTNSRFMNNNATQRGGAIYILYGDPTISNSVFIDNTAYANGGAICFWRSIGEITDSYFETNNATNGMGGAINLAVGGTVTDCEFVDNDAFMTNAALAVGGIDAYVANCNFTGSNCIAVTGTAILENNNELTAKDVAGYSVRNHGKGLTLINNKFNSTIINGPTAKIISDINATVLGNKTINTTDSTYDLTATIVDDAGNWIKVDEIKFLVNGEEIDAAYDPATGLYVATLNISKVGIYEVNLTKVNNTLYNAIIRNIKGTFTDLQNIIDNAGTSIDLAYNFTYNEVIDGDKFVDGVKIDRDIEIIGQGYTIDGNDTARIFNINASDVVLDNITFINGKAARGGAIYYSLVNGSLTVENSRFYNNTATTDKGGAIFVWSGEPVISGSEFINNIAYANGGAICFWRAVGEITDSYFETNNATRGVGGAINLAVGGTVTGCEFVDNDAFGTNPALAIGGTDSYVADCNFTGSDCIWVTGTATLENNKELTPKDVAGYSVLNVGNGLTLINNDFNSIIKVIGKNSKIISIMNATILENKTIDANLGDVVTLTLLLTDDAGNLINDPNVKFSVNGGDAIDATFNDDLELYEANYTIVDAGLNVVSTTYPAENIKTGIIDVALANVTEFTVSVNDIVDGENATVFVTLIGVNNTGLTADVTVIVNNKEYIVNVVNGTGNNTIEDLAHGQYPVVAMFNDNPNYNHEINSTVFYVKGQSVLNITEVTVAEYGDEIEITINLTDSEGTPISGIVVIDKVNKVIVYEDGIGTFIIDIQPDVGNYNFQAVYDGDDDYFGCLDLFNVTVVPKEIDPNDVVVEIPNTNEYGEAIPVTITSPVDGNYTVAINGSAVVIEVVNGTGSVNITLANPGIYNATVNINDENYSLETITTNDFGYKTTPDFNAIIKGTYPNAEISITGPAGTYHVLIDGRETIDITREESGLPTVYIIEDIEAGNYTALVSFDKDDEYYGDYKEVNFTVAKAGSRVTIDPIADVVYGNPVEITFSIENKTESIRISITDENGKSYDSKLNGSTITAILPAGEYTIVINNNENENYTESEANAVFTVAKAEALTITVEGEIGVMGGATVNITVADDATGYIIVDDNGNKDVYELVNGSYSFEIYDLEAGEYTIAVTYLGDDNYNKTEDKKVLTIAKTVVTPEITDLTSEIAGGQNATFTVTMSNNFANGNVSVYVDGVLDQVVVLDADYANATVVISGLGNGTHTIVVQYNGNDNYEAVVNATASVTVEMAASKVTIDPIAISYDGDVVITFTIENETDYVNINIIDVNDPEKLIDFEYEDGIITVKDLPAGTYRVNIHNGESDLYYESEASATFYVCDNVVTNDTFFNYFDEDGVLLDVVPFDELIFKGEFADLGITHITVNDIKITGEDAVLTNIGFVAQDDVELSNMKLVANESIGSLIYVVGDNVDINGMNISYTVNNESSIVIEVYDVEDVNIADNVIYFESHAATDDIEAMAISVEDATGVVIDNNDITANLTAVRSNWGIYYTYGTMGIDKVHAVRIAGSSDVELTGNDIVAVINDGISTGGWDSPTIEAILVIDSEDISIADNDISVLDPITPEGTPAYLYGLTLTSVYDLEVFNNYIYLSTKGGVDASGTSYAIQLATCDVEISYNDIVAESNGPNIGIYISGISSYSSLYNENFTVVIENNDINVTGYANTTNHASLVSGIEACAGEIIIAENTIEVNNKAGYVEGANVYGISYAQTYAPYVPEFDIENNIITVNDGKYAVGIINNASAVVTSNFLVAHELFGDEAVFANETISTVENNFPAYLNITVSVDNVTFNDPVVFNIHTNELFSGIVQLNVGENTYEIEITDGVGSKSIVLPAGDYKYTVDYVGYPLNSDDFYVADHVLGNLTVSKIEEDPSEVLNITTPENSTSQVISIDMPEDATGYLLLDIDGKQTHVPLVDGKANVTVPNLPEGTYNATITYTGDSKYAPITTTKEINVTSNVPDDALTIPENASSDEPTTYSISLPSNATGYLEVDVDGTKYVAPLVNGSASVSVPALSEGNHNVTVTYTGDDNYSPVTKATTLSVKTPVYNIAENKNVNVIYSAKASYKVLITRDGKAVGAGESVAIKFNGKTYTVKTDAKGYATLNLNTKVKVKSYAITATYKGVTVKNTVKVKHLIKASNKKIKKSKKVNKIKVKTNKVNGKYLKGKKLTLKIKGKKVKAKINKKGVAIFKLKKSITKKLKAGKKYKYTVTYGKDKVTKKVKVKR